mgnify:CR=1 FL=1
MGYHGWYYRVLDEGEIMAGMEAELIGRVHPQISIRRMNEVLKAPEEWPELVRVIATSPAATDGWRRRMNLALTEIEG